MTIIYILIHFLHKFIVEKEDFSYLIFKIFLYIELNDKKENLISTLVLFKKNDIYYSSLYIRRCDGVKYINFILIECIRRQMTMFYLEEIIFFRRWYVQFFKR